MLYYKQNGENQVFSQCAGMSYEEISEAGWQIYNPTIPRYPRNEPDFTEVMDAVKRMLQSSPLNVLSDKEALEVAALYPTWASKIGQSVTTGERLWYDGKLYKVIQPHTVQQEWTPDVTPALYTEVSIEEFPAWRQPLGSEDAYRLGDKVSHNSLHWQSNIDYNTYEPGVYGWEQLA